MDWITGITRLALGKPAVVFLVTLLVIVAGVFAVFRIKTELFPDIDLPVVTVATSYPGASPDAVLEDVTIPVENAVASVSELKELRSISTENLSVVTTQFDYGTDMDKVEQEIAAKVDGLVMPTGANQPTVGRIDLADFPIIYFSVFGERDVSELETIARSDVLPALEQVDGVAQVAISGAAAQQVWVTLDPQKLAQYGLTTQQVVKALQENNVSSPSGVIFDSQGRVLPVRTTSRYTSLADISNLAVTSSEGASPVLLGDIGQVQMDTDRFASITRTKGHPSLGITVVKGADANTVEVANSVQDKVSQIRERLPADVEIVTHFDQSDFIEESIASLLREGALGFLFAVIIIYIFLTGIRTTLVTAVSIPLSIIIALIVLAWQGITLNMITMAGLTVAIGRVVDDSIVVLENIYRHARQGEKLSEAAYTATREVGTAVFASTLTTVAVFLPLALAGGLVGEMFFSFALTITIALLASLAVALTIVPTLARYLLQVAPAEGGRPGWLRWLLPFGARQPRPSPGEGAEETWLQRIYTPVLRWALAHRLATLSAGLVLFIGSFALLPFIGVSFLPGSNLNVLNASVELPPGTSLTTTEAKAQEIEETLSQAEGLDIYAMLIGQPDPSSSLGSLQLASGRIPTSGTIAMYLTYHKSADLDKAAAWLRDALNALPGEKEVSVQQMSGASQTDKVQISITADSLEDAQAANDQLLLNLKDVESLTNVSSDLVSAQPEVEVQVDSQKASAYGLSAQDVSQRVRDALFGQKATQAQLDGSTTDVYVRVAYDGSSSDQGALALPLAPGGTPTLGDVATVTVAEKRVQVSRVDQRRAATIYGIITSDNMQAVSGKVDDAIARVQKAPGVKIEKGGIFEQQAEAFGSLYMILAVAVIVVYIVMVASLGSLVNPLIIMVSLPFATIGSFFALFITQREIGLPAMIGFLMLIGIVVTNAIVLITFVEQQRARGLSTHEALIQSGRARARPILMTAVATIFALIPLSLGLNEGALIAAELGTVVIGGLFTSTILTLLVIPVVYSLVDNWRSRLRGQPADG
ncbi:MAG: efflux RND transporter permease subunit [Dehalococcoidia bacterium]|nr:efflux RND transporter permease subunit [Dehalococcoidia bacterium]